jgi:hypothetical protein
VLLGKLASFVGCARDVSGIKTDIHEIRGHQERDFRLLFGTIIGITLGLAGLMAKGFGWLH